MFARGLNAGDILTSHLRVFNEFLKDAYHYVGNHLYDFAFGDFDLYNFRLRTESINRAMLAESGVGVVTFGPAFYPFHAVFINPKSSENCQKQLAAIMDIPEPQARCPYSYISYKTSSTFFLALNNDKAKSLRAKMVGLLTPRHFEAQLEKRFSQLLWKLASTESQYLDKSKILSHHLFCLFSSVLFNYDLPIELYESLKKVTFVNNFVPALMPEQAYYLLPEFREKRREFDKEVKKFLYPFFANIRTNWNLSVELEKGNLLAKIFNDKYPCYQSFAELTDGDIHHLVDDPDIRLCVTGLIGVENLSLVLVPGLMKMYEHNNLRILSVKEKLNLELAMCLGANESRGKFLESRPNFPYLHAVYLEIMRFTPPMHYVSRYTSAGLKSNGLDIPPRSLIFFSLADMLWNCATYANSAFMPERFLDMYGELRPDAKLNTGFLLPGGAGHRSCPGANISKWLIEYYVLGFARYVNHLSANDCALSQRFTATHNTFTTVEEITHEKEDVKAAASTPAIADELRLPTSQWQNIQNACVRLFKPAHLQFELKAGLLVFTSLLGYLLLRNKSEDDFSLFTQLLLLALTSSFCAVALNFAVNLHENAGIHKTKKL